MNVSEALALPSHVLEVALQVVIHDRQAMDALADHADQVARLKEDLKHHAARH